MCTKAYTFAKFIISLAVDVPIILLNEVTASLDVENETVIQTILSGLIQKKSVLVITRRMRIVVGVDHIVVFVDGPDAEQGSAVQLIRSMGIYAHMFRLQAETLNWALDKMSETAAGDSSFDFY